MPFWSGRPTTHTNAPRHWPAIELSQFENAGVNLIIVGGQLAALAKRPGASMAFMRDFVYEDGILRVPIVVEEGGQKTCVFVYTNRDKNAAAHYSGVRALLRTRENALAVYYGPEALAPTTAGVVLQPIDTPFFSKAAEERDAAFALWWASEESPRLAGSEEMQSLDRWFESMDGYGYVLLTAFLKDLEVVKDDTSAYALPSQPLLQPVIGPGETRMLLHASAGEGLFLAFDVATPVSRRRVVLRLLADFAVQCRRAIDAKGLAPHDQEKGRGVACWRAIREAALAKEAAGQAQLRVHGITVRDGQPMRDPHASGAEDRAGAPAAPGREELDFGMDLLDALVARLRDKRVAGSTQAEIGQPNFTSIVAAKVGSDVIERRIPYEDLPVVQEAASRALDEWPEAEIVVAIGDAAVRENGQRVDVVNLKIENRKAGRAATLFQRYRVGADGAVELIGRPTASPEPRFLLESTVSREPAPDAALVALAQQARDEILKMLSLGGRADRKGDDPEDTLFMPSALVAASGDAPSTLVCFAMQGPITAAASCAASLRQKPADSVVFYIDDLVSRNGRPERRVRLCVQRSEDARLAIFDQPYEPPRDGKPCAAQGELVFRRWGGSMFPAPTPAPPPNPRSSDAPPRPMARPAAPVPSRTIVPPPSGTFVPKVSFSSPAMTIDALAAAIKHVLRRLRMTADGFELTRADGQASQYAWADVQELWVRRLPNERPWESHPVLELVTERGGTREIARLFATSAVSAAGESLPPTRLEQMRRIATVVLGKVPALTADAATRKFAEGRGHPAALLVIDELTARNL